MLVGASVIAFTVAFFACAQIVVVRHYTRWVGHHDAAAEGPVTFPRAAVVVCLRGADPFLDECFKRLSEQAYPDFEIHVMIDHPTDPARAVAERWAATHPELPLKISFLEQRLENAYLKASAIRQCVLSLDPTIQVVAIADADTLVYPRWLQDMVSPLLRADVGAVTGNRWYDANNAGWGTLTRFIYNATSLVPMYFMRTTWGGSLSMRREVFGSQYFADRTLDTFSEEPAIQSATRQANLDLELQPNAMILNREKCTLHQAFGFMRRQLAWTRLFHQDWSKVLIGTVVVYLVFAVAVILAIVCAIAGQWLAATLLTCSLAGSLLVCHWSLLSMHTAIARRVSNAQDDPFPPLMMMTKLRLLVMLPLSLMLISWAVISASLCRKISWRGIDYEIVPPDSVKMTDYRPYADVSCNAPKEASLT